MRLRQIETFYAVYSAGSISKAAELLSVSQPAVSKMLRHTEDILGFDLFERTPTGLVPTQEATELFEGAARIFSEVSRFRLKADAVGLADGKPLRIALAPSIGLSAGPSAVAEFASAYPDIGIEIETLHFEEASDALRAETTDIAIAYQPYPREGLRILPLTEARFVCVTPAGHWTNKGASIDFKDLAEETLIHLKVDAPLGNLLSSRLDQVANTQQSQRIVVNTYYIAKMLVAQKTGIAIVDEFAANAPSRDAVDIYDFKEDMGLSVGAIVRDGYALAKHETAFIDLLRASLTHNQPNTP